MIIQCDVCKNHFDDEFRNTDCSHDTFLANDGQNNFKHYSESWLADHAPNKIIEWQRDKSEHQEYLEWKENNKVKINE